MAKDGKKLWRLTKQLNDEGSRYSKITLIQDDTLIHGKTAANLFADTLNLRNHQVHTALPTLTLENRHYTSCLKSIINHGKKDRYHNPGESNNYSNTQARKSQDRSHKLQIH